MLRRLLWNIVGWICFENRGGQVENQIVIGNQIVE